VVEREAAPRAPRLLFAPIRPGDAWPGCAWAGVGLQRCGLTIAYDVTKYEERGGQLWRRVAGALEPVALRGLSLGSYTPPSGMMVAPAGTCHTLAQWLVWNPNPQTALHPGEADLRLCIQSQSENADGTWTVTGTVSGSLPMAGTGVMTPIPPITQTTQRPGPALVPRAGALPWGLIGAGLLGVALLKIWRPGW
jgi:hypothetical protein